MGSTPPSPIRSLLVAVRLHNCLICGLVLLAGWPGGMAVGVREGIPAALALGLLCAAANLVNDLLDLPADRGNRPQRPLPAGQLDLEVARRAALVCLMAGLVVGLATAPHWWAWWLFWALGGVGYSLFAKGRVLVAPLWAALLIGGCWLAGAGMDGLVARDWLVLAVIVWFLFFREIIKGLEDARGDLLGGYASCAGLFPGNRAGLLLLGLPLAGLGLLLLVTAQGPVAAVSAAVFLVCLGLAVAFILIGGPRRGPKPGSLLKIGAFMGVAQLMVTRFP